MKGESSMIVEISQAKVISFFKKIFENKSEEECELTIISEVPTNEFSVGNIDATETSLCCAVDITKRKVAEKICWLLKSSPHCDKLKTLFLQNLSQKSELH